LENAELEKGGGENKNTKKAIQPGTVDAEHRMRRAKARDDTEEAPYSFHCWVRKVTSERKFHRLGCQGGEAWLFVVQEGKKRTGRGGGNLARPSKREHVGGVERWEKKGIQPDKKMVRLRNPVDHTRKGWMEVRGAGTLDGQVMWLHLNDGGEGNAKMSRQQVGKIRCGLRGEGWRGGGGKLEIYSSRRNGKKKQKKTLKTTKGGKLKTRGSGGTAARALLSGHEGAPLATSKTSNASGRKSRV